MKTTKSYPYYEGFIQAVDYACQSAELLYISLQSFDVEQVEEMMVSLHRIEHAADEAKHQMMNQLAREFLPPLAREDIVSLAQEIDNVTDSIEDVLMRIFMFHIQVIRPEAISFADLIQRCCIQLKQIVKELSNFRKSTILPASIIEVNHLEEEADQLYCNSMRALYATRLDPIETISWNETFEQMEKCCDLCEKVANLVETIVMKST
ncbi:MAG: DUF47 domain-containing protein [Candidatus Merdivicinus sp.]|jgi:predicted phosphate transport protein (TIGR00153 family)